MLKRYCTPATTSYFMKFYFVSRSKVRLMKNFIPQIRLSEHVITVIYTCYAQNKIVTLWKQVNHNMKQSLYVIQKDYFVFCFLLKCDILSSINVHITKSKISYRKYFSNFEQVKAITVLWEFLNCKFSWEPSSRDIWTAFLYSIGVSSNSILQIRRLQETRNTRKNVMESFCEKIVSNTKQLINAGVLRFEAWLIGRN